MEPLPFWSATNNHTLNAFYLSPVQSRSGEVLTQEYLISFLGGVPLQNTPQDSIATDEDKRE